MKINPDKFNTIIFGNDHNSLELYFNGTTVGSMNEVKLLGVTVDKKPKILSTCFRGMYEDKLISKCIIYTYKMC